MASLPKSEVLKSIGNINDYINVENGSKVVNEALKVLVDALDDDYNAVAADIARANGIAATIDAMQQFPQDASTQRCGCIILYAVSTIDDRYKREVCDKGGITRLLFAIENFMDDETSRFEALRALYLLTLVDPSSIAEGVPLFLKAMEIDLDDINTQDAACTMLLRLAAIGCCTLLLDAGCIPTAVASLERYLEIHGSEEDSVKSTATEDMKLPMTILALFMTILSVVPISNDFAEGGGFQAALRMMRHGKNCFEIQSLTCRILRHIHNSQEHERATIVEAGGVELLLSAVNLFLHTVLPESDKRRMIGLKEAIGTLFILSVDCFDAVTAIQRAGGFRIIIDVMNEPFPNDQLAEKLDLHVVCMMVPWLCIKEFSENSMDMTLTFLSGLITCGAIPTILFSMEQFPNDVSIQYRGCAILASLLSGTGTDAAAVVVDGGKWIIERAKMQYGNDGRVQLFGNTILQHIEGMDDGDRCHWCYTSSGHLLQCSRCQKVLYCSKDCQREDHKLHRGICKQMASRGSNSRG